METYLIVASSARFIAQSAVDGNYSVVAIDGFSDGDLQTISKHCVKIPPNLGRMDSTALLAAAQSIGQQYQIDGVVIGPGLEECHSFVEVIQQRLPFYGNNSDVIKQCNDRGLMLTMLNGLDIPTLHDKTSCDELMLYKQKHACGGGHIQWQPAKPFDGVQEIYLPGIAISHLFLADTKEFFSLGFNTQWQSRHDDDRPFSYGGAINRSPLNKRLKESIEMYTRRMVQHLGLKGINNVDYLLNLEKLYCLELNPRPSASMQINEGQFKYQRGDIAKTLFCAHLRACQGELPRSSINISSPSAYAVVYASGPMPVPQFFWTHENIYDVPSAETQIATGDPLCSVKATADNVKETFNQLQRQIHTILSNSV